jgi:DNA-binding transcriptional MocR family regulator
MLIARRSRAKIAQDPFRMGAQLPTEHALCRCYRLSRFIVREAMSMLSAAGPSPCRQRAHHARAGRRADEAHERRMDALQDFRGMNFTAPER